MPTLKEVPQEKERHPIRTRVIVLLQIVAMLVALSIAGWLISLVVTDLYRRFL
jgi:hypothetical protein